MLSKAEMEFLKNPEKFDANYRYVLRHHIKAKSAQMREHAILLQGVGLNLTENCKNLTTFCNINPSLNQALNKKTVAGSLGFEPRIPGSGGRCLDPC